MAATAKFDPADAADGLYTPSRSLTGLALDLVRPYHKWLITIFFAMLVETIAGIQTVKAAALEPVFGKRWDNQLAAYVAASFRTQNLAAVPRYSCRPEQAASAAPIRHLRWSTVGPGVALIAMKQWRLS